ncbi:glycosyltransferase family 2 protein [Aerococcus sanguinicola]|uniref:glycosyltransferase family 2 protein n=1 Tax=unclassified Aerococcus TaxID=2618060 RepID=UPI0008A6343A|nr:MULTISPECIES: glycosyltransferase family 2 protein [unclassified Aerococcus]KAB0647969.1 glycosyltransferase family 2 protein [Aerococcus sanguinicola]MDK6233469.1 glycosyltransferase family 2 protein [Aerococcus sp. UMB10185]MDK6855548.1 glycosyltransferase family 2 protein [Aerococcus sp. UMB7533]MDK8502267.1 glycosyltransferase family 2 protein [Aerococcus sp. UMB1112A]OFN02389.1 glycosyl transferase [Aerococcus sp. HMSC062A02]
MQDDLVSIITPVYQAEKYLAHTIESVQAQDYKNWEMLLVDDCSPDQSAQIIKAYQAEDARIKYLKLDTNSGAAVARNRGLEVAQGRYIAFVDSDDYWTSDKLAKQLAFMKAEAYGFTYTNFAQVDEEGQVLKDRADLPQHLDYDGLLKNTAIACSTVMIDRHLVGDFRMPLVRKGQDTATWLMLMRERDCQAYLLDEVLNHYRQVPGSISSNRLGALKRTWHTYRVLEGLPLWKACYVFISYALNAIKRRI